MPYLRSVFRIKFAHGFFAAFALCAFVAHGAEWRECEQAKQRQLQLQLQKNSSSRKTSKRKSQRRADDRRQRAEEIDTWLWKNCREFSYELRQLEQDNM